MKTQALIITIAASFITFISCEEPEVTFSETAVENVVATPEAEVQPVVTSTTMYVSAPSGLSLRKHNNLNSKKLAVMPYGTPVKIIEMETENTMSVNGIEGGMHKVMYNNKEGFAFTGYLSSFFPPEKGARAKQYITALQQTHPTANFEEVTGGTASNPMNSEIVKLPTNQWQEAFYVAQQLYEIPRTFSFPKVKGGLLQTIKNPKESEYLLVSELQITRNEVGIEKMVYSQAGEGYGSTVTIVIEGEHAIITWEAVAD